MCDGNQIVVHQQRMRTQSARETRTAAGSASAHSTSAQRRATWSRVDVVTESTCKRKRWVAHAVRCAIDEHACTATGGGARMRAAVCVPFSPATLLHLGSIPNNPRRVSLCNTRCCLVRLQMAHVIHVANVDRNKRPRNAVGVGAARSSAVVCCGYIGRPEVVPNEGHSIPLLSAHLVWVSSCTPHAADTHHRHNSHPQHMSSHSLSARQSHGAVGAKRNRHVCPHKVQPTLPCTAG